MPHHEAKMDTGPRGPFTVFWDGDHPSEGDQGRFLFSCPHSELTDYCPECGARITTVHGFISPEAVEKSVSFGLKIEAQFGMTLATGNPDHKHDPANNPACRRFEHERHG